MWQGRRPVPLPVERISGKRYATPVVWSVEASKVDGHAVHMQVSKARHKFIPIFLAPPQRGQKQSAILWQRLLRQSH